MQAARRLARDGTRADGLVTAEEKAGLRQLRATLHVADGEIPPTRQSLVATALLALRNRYAA